MASKPKMISETKLEQVVALRNNRVHMSSIMLVHIVSHLNKRTGSAYLGEIKAYYDQLSTKYPAKIGYTETGIRTHLKTLKDKGFLKVTKDGMFNRYECTIKGLLSVHGLF